MKCDYGCDREAKYTLKNGKHCCERIPAKCPGIRKKNSQGIRKAIEENRGPWCKGSWNGSIKNCEALALGNQHRIEKQMQEAFVENSKVSNAAINNYLINYLKWEKRCSCCGLSEWQGREIPLELHHINGIPTDNRLENLTYLCLNCHAITNNFRGKNINSGKQKVTEERLEEALKNNSSIRSALIEVGLSPRGGNYTRAYKILQKIKTENN